MIQFFFCLFLLVPVVVLPVAMLTVSVPLGIVTALVSVVLAIPLLLAASAHLDLRRAKSQFDLTDEELDEFSRLVPVVAAQPEFSGMRPRERRRSTKQAAADMIHDRRRRSAASASGRQEERDGVARAVQRPAERAKRAPRRARSVREKPTD